MADSADCADNLASVAGTADVAHTVGTAKTAHAGTAITAHATGAAITAHAANADHRAGVAHDGDAGFSLIEVVICVALLVAACVAGLGVLPTLVHASQADVMRDAATNLGRLALERVRAATAYAPASKAGAPAGHAGALNPTASYTAAIRVQRSWCGNGQTTTDVPMTVALVYDTPSDTVTATVAYPRDPCAAPATTAQVVVSAQLAPSAPAPGTTVTAAIGDPSQQ